VPTSPQLDVASRTLEQLRRQIADLTRVGKVSPGLLQALVDECPEPVIIIDDDAHILLVNGLTARLVGMSTRQLQTLTSWDLTHTTYQSDFDILWKEFQRAGRQRGVFGLRHLDGSLVEVAYAAEAHVLPGRSLVVFTRFS
jgi:PAS domain S-box-containing protein